MSEFGLAQFMEYAIDFGIVPVGFILFIFYLVQLNNNLRRQNEKILDQMMDLVRELTNRNQG